MYILYLTKTFQSNLPRSLHITPKQINILFQKTKNSLPNYIIITPNRINNNYLISPDILSPNCQMFLYLTFNSRNPVTK